MSIALAAGSAGCSVIDDYRQCGLHGCAGDARISSDVRALFARHAELGGVNRLSVQTVRGVVYLSGVVDTDLEREIASDVAGEAPGVIHVVNSIGLSNGR
jgi:osmotically-inducible protein OsmY